jgi:uncharacterized protein HemX
MTDQRGPSASRHPRDDVRRGTGNLRLVPLLFVIALALGIGAALWGMNTSSQVRQLPNATKQTTPAPESQPGKQP